jgi:hypothetical protein
VPPNGGLCHRRLAVGTRLSYQCQCPDQKGGKEIHIPTVLEPGEPAIWSFLDNLGRPKANFLDDMGDGLGAGWECTATGGNPEAMWCRGGCSLGGPWHTDKLVEGSVEKEAG